MSLTKEDSCYTTSNKYCACIEFHLDEDRRHGFHTSQLIDYTLEPNPDAGENAPPQRLALAFSTADVVILGWRLGRLAEAMSRRPLSERDMNAVLWSGLFEPVRQPAVFV
ncbi:MAG TPA: hypothetical protein VMV72_00615 [Verrucomicrobiae bacterium]|nr:hypothetical protein [Verrucomicrobiae bacterium]